ncbi:MmcQ/YjbR family DNA-binding protein [Paenibacillus eucommiae]|uniref:MmcQ/YjbR family DNA-binding protein n=1 Tax=Paenibacillus eucommiae TaxID=1355755 RepID=A0ABS4IPB6_9BACL|nr:MmcQ/YjbR family DNA-binding protein [Paenibacillus eucommiae]MBP1988876.1 hypothetical protein [Paenibacillus eucommiae]
MNPNNLQLVRKLAHSFPGTEEGTAYGTPAFRVRGKILCRIQDDEETLVLKMDFEMRDFLLQADLETYYITDHYQGYPYILVRLSLVKAEELRQHMEQAWRHLALKRVVAEYDRERLR